MSHHQGKHRKHKTIDKNIDGLITANIETNNIVMDYYNNDGSWETLCVNALKCVGLLLNNTLDLKIKLKLQEKN